MECTWATEVFLTNSRTDIPSSLPRPTSIEAILQNPSSAAVNDLAADPRLGYIGDWTRVTDDTGFLAHLFTIWTEREYVYYHFLDRDAFLTDLSSGRDDFCSELLVNVVLASACVSRKIFFSVHAQPNLEHIANDATVSLVFSQGSQQAILETFHPNFFLLRGEAALEP